jgi:hypothetical protein
LVWLVPGAALAEDPPRQRAEKLLTEEAKTPAPVADYVARSRNALTRATQARAAGDAGHANQLEALALELAETAHDLHRTTDAEALVTQQEKRAIELEEKLMRARTLVEQTAARRGRAVERLQEVEAQRGTKTSAAKAATASAPSATPPIKSSAPNKAGGSR